MTPGSDTASRPRLVSRGKLKREQVRLHLVSEIAVGNLRAGDALPPEHQLAEMMGVSRSTIRQTLGELEREGKILRVQGRGTFVAQEVSNRSSTEDDASFAILVPDVLSSYYSSLLAAFEQASHDAGRSAVVCTSNNNVDKQASQILRLLDQEVAGVVLNPSATAPTPACQVRMLQKSGIPVALLHRPVEGVMAPLVRLRGEEVGQCAGDLIAEAGHRRVAFMSSGVGEASEKQEAGFRNALASRGIELLDTQIAHGEMVLFSGADSAHQERCITEALEKLLRIEPPPTAIFVSFDSVAEMAYLVLQRMGLRVPEDVSLVTFGGSRQEGAIRRRLTTITVNEVAAVQQAVHLIVEMRHGKRPLINDEEIVLPLGVNPGETLLKLKS